MSTESPHAPWSALLLAGGRSSRMGEDKALLPLNGAPLWLIQARKLAVLRPGRLFISCREEQNLQQACPADLLPEWVFDPPGQGGGPLLPVLQTLKVADTALLVLAVDLPEMTSAFLEEAVSQRGDAALFFRSRHSVEPLAGIYTPAMIPLMERAVAEGRYSLRRIIEEAEDEALALVPALAPADEGLFMNANTPGEWRTVTG